MLLSILSDEWVPDRYQIGTGTTVDECEENGYQSTRGMEYPEVRVPISSRTRAYGRSGRRDGGYRYRFLGRVLTRAGAR